MALVSVRELATALRVSADSAELGKDTENLLARLNDAAEALVERYAPGAPDAVREEACIRIAAYLYDQPDAASASRYASAWRNSGAYALCSPWFDRGLGFDSEATE